MASTTNATYGPTTNTTTLNGDLYVNSDATLRNMTVNGTIYVNPGQNGNVTLNNVTATNIVILSGGTNSIILNNVNVTNQLTVKDDDSVRVETNGTTTVAKTLVQSGAILEAKAGSFGAINLAPTSASPVTLKGNFGTSAIQVSAPNTVLNVATGAQVGTLTVDAAGATVNNAGTITEVEANQDVEITGTQPGTIAPGDGVNHTAMVNNQAELEAALANSTIKQIKLTKDITMTVPVAPKKGVTIDGDNYTLTLNATSDSNNKTAEGLHIAKEANDVIMKNLKVTRAGETNKDNLIEIYGDNATLENVEVNGGAKAGIYVNNNGKGNLTVNFKSIKTAGNGWDAGIGLAAKQSNDKVIANFSGTNIFGEKVAVYHEGTTYPGTYEVNGLGEFKQATVGNQQKWFTNAPTVTVNLPKNGFVVGKVEEFTISTVANGLAGINVIGNSTHEFRNAIGKIEYYEVKNQTWYELDGNFGPGQGFPLADATSKFRVTFNAAGNYSFTTDIREASNNGNVLATTSTIFNVQATK